MQLQMLSIILSTVNKPRLIRALIPGITKRQILSAQRYVKTVGAGVPVLKITHIRTYITYMQINHFICHVTLPQFVQDVAFGVRTLKFDNGERRELPSSVWTVCAQRLIQNYRQHCCDSNYGGKIPSDSTLFAILAKLGGRHMRALQGLDNIQATGVNAFDQLFKSLVTMEEQGLPLDSIAHTRHRLESLLRYFRLDYHTHVLQKDSCCSTHCPVYALSVENSSEFGSECEHDHELCCERCLDWPIAQNELSRIMDKFPQSVASDQSEEIREALQYDIETAVEDIDFWRNHIIRTHNQQRSKHDALKNLKEDEAYLIIDYAMKFLPLLFREKQRDFFGKTGDSWHFSCFATRKDEDSDYCIWCIIHLLGQSPQNWFAVASILEHALSEIKKLNEKVTKIKLRADKAANYHSGDLVASFAAISRRTGCEIISYDHSEPQTGKDLCDRKIASVKNHIRRYVAEGNDVDGCDQLFKAISSNGGVRGCYVYNSNVVPDNNTMKRKVKWPDFASYNDFLFEKDDNTNEVTAIRAFKAYQIGSGRVFQLSGLLEGQQLEQTGLQVSTIATPSVSTGIIPNIAQRPPSPTPSVASATSEVSTASEDQVQQSNDMYCCHNAYCHATFERAEELEAHMDQDNHDVQLIAKTTFDMAREIYIEKLTGIKAGYDITTDANFPIDATIGAQEKMGFAIAKRRKPQRKTPDQVEYITKLFERGKTTGVKISPIQAAEMMKKVRKDDGSLRFPGKLSMHKDKIATFFSSLHSLDKKLVTREIVEESQNADEHEEVTTDAQEQLVALQQEIELDDVCTEVLSDIGFQHPVMFQDANLCKLRNDQCLNKLTIPQGLEALENMGEVLKKRTPKKEILEILDRMLSKCSCCSSE